MSLSEERVLPPWKGCLPGLECVLVRCLLTTCALCFVVGGLRSPWRGEYKEPRRPPPQPAHVPSHARSRQTVHAQPREPGPQPAEDTTGGAPKLQPPLPPEPPERNRSASLNWAKEEPGTWEPLPLSSLDPAPPKNPSSPERKATFPEQELQQLEIGMGSHGCGLWVPGLGPGPPPSPVLHPFSSQCEFSSSPSPEVGSCSLCRKNPDSTASPFPGVHSHLWLFSAELFLNSLSQPFSLEEQEQILSCLSVDSLSLSEDSEKVRWPWTRSQGTEQVALCPAGGWAMCKEWVKGG